VATPGPEWEKFLPPDKSEAMRFGLLDIIHGSKRVESVLKTPDMPEDLIALRRCAMAWRRGEVLDVGESGTLLRFLRFLVWKRGERRGFSMRGTLVDRPITDDPAIVSLSQRELLKLDDETTQWASAAALCGDPERLPDAPFKLLLTYDTIDRWRQIREQGQGRWELRTDETIARQAEVFVRALVDRDRRPFAPRQAEDFCFAYAFGYMDVDQARALWPNLKGHESNRLLEMPIALAQMRAGDPITSRDHRVVQAVAMRAAYDGPPPNFVHAECVGKSWPLFWNFMSYALDRYDEERRKSRC
jgi:hypothetical protein